MAASHLSPVWVVSEHVAHGFSIWACYFSRDVNLQEASFIL